MSWISASLLSALLLGCYELFTKQAVRDNAVLPVLFLSTVCGSAIWLGLMAAHALRPGAFPPALAVVPLSLGQHLRLLLKSAIVASAWVCIYFAVKRLPVSIASPVQATGPLWSFLGGLAILGERPRAMQIVGVFVAIASLIGLSAAGRGETRAFHRNPWIWALLAGSLLNAISSLYDKYLFGRAGFAPATVQAWFMIYLSILFLPLAVGWKLRWWPRHQFQWRWSIPLLCLSLLLADFAYFGALREPGALISIVAVLRRGSMVVAFAGAIALFGERGNRQKVAAAVGVLAGIALTIAG